MKRSYPSACIGVAMTFVLGMFTVLGLGCGTIDVNGLLELETCDILNCDGLLFGSLADDHDDMADMDEMDDAGAHDDGDDDHMDAVDDHSGDDDDGSDMDDPDGDDDDGDHMDDMDGHDDDDAQVEEDDDAAEGDDGSGPGVARS